MRWWAVWRIGRRRARADSPTTVGIKPTVGLAMYFDERDEGDYRIYADAVEVPTGGYRAAAVVTRLRGVPKPVEVFRDEQMSGGHAWDDPEDALHFAVKASIAIIREHAASTRAPVTCAFEA